jgi:hypothetical protein
MKALWITVLACLVALISLDLAAQTPAAEFMQRTDPSLFIWASDEEIRWEIGALYAGLGVAGALVMMFSLVGGTVPGTAGKARLDAEQRRLDALTTQIEEATKLDADGAPALIEALNKAADALRDDLNAERARQFMLALLLYTLLGALFATMLAQGMVQAIVFGATWTNLLGAFGLRSEFDVQVKRKDEAILAAENALGGMYDDPDATIASEVQEAGWVTTSELDDVMQKLRSARAR